MPKGVKLIVSFRHDDESGARFLRYLQNAGDVILSEVNPFDDLDDRRRLVRAYLSQYLKELDAGHLEKLIQSPGAGNPLYLKVVLSELRVFGAFASLAEKVRGDFGDTPVSAFHGMLGRLEKDPAYSPVPPDRAVSLLFSLLAHARYGLSPNELIHLFIHDLRLKDTSEVRQTVADTVYLFLRKSVRYLARRQGRYAFFFESFYRAVRERYVGNVPACLRHLKRAGASCIGSEGPPIGCHGDLRKNGTPSWPAIFMVCPPGQYLEAGGTGGL